MDVVHPEISGIGDTVETVLRAIQFSAQDDAIGVGTPGLLSFVANMLDVSRGVIQTNTSRVFEIMLIDRSEAWEGGPRFKEWPEMKTAVAAVDVDKGSLSKLSQDELAEELWSIGRSALRRMAESERWMVDRLPPDEPPDSLICGEHIVRTQAAELSRSDFSARGVLATTVRWTRVSLEILQGDKLIAVVRSPDVFPLSLGTDPLASTGLRARWTHGPRARLEFRALGERHVLEWTGRSGPSG